MQRFRSACWSGLLSKSLRAYRSPSVLYDSDAKMAYMYPLAQELVPIGRPTGSAVSGANGKLKMEGFRSGTSYITKTSLKYCGIKMTTNCLHVTLLQLCSFPSIEMNESRLKQFLTGIPTTCDLLILPENFLCLGNNESIRKAARSYEETVELLKPFAKHAGSAVVFGGVPIREENRILNVSLVITEEGECIARYDKIHLYQFDPKSPKGIDETTVFSHGDTPVAFDFKGWSIGLTICYDLRFPELYRSTLPVDLFICTAAFNATTGLAHWETLIKARAIENQCFFAACGQSGRNMETGGLMHGNSMVVDPWGDVVARVETNSEQLLQTELFHKRIENVRERLPAVYSTRMLI